MYTQEQLNEAFNSETKERNEMYLEYLGGRIAQELKKIPAYDSYDKVKFTLGDKPGLAPYILNDINTCLFFISRLYKCKPTLELVLHESTSTN